MVRILSHVTRVYIIVCLKQFAHIDSFTMPAKQKKGRGRGRVAATPNPQSTESVHAPAASDEESSRASTVSETVRTKKDENHRREREKIPMDNAHQDVLAEFRLNHPIFYDKSLFSWLIILSQNHRTTIVRPSSDTCTTFTRTSCDGRW